ncbi:MAG: LicD family protein [Lachnospiraceae bacterium]|nr:LicD family protein [Lachnospiraceae bacterium]
MVIPEAFLESEVREGFYIPSKMKRAWGAILLVLHEIDTVCKRHHLKWWMDFGSMLATVRHHGFIPWDDDIDIAMFREDYEAFLQFAPNELPKEYTLYNIHNNVNCDLYFTRVCNSTVASIEPEYLERNAGFPYLGGIDLMCVDYVSPKFDRCIVELVRPVDAFADAIGNEARLGDIPEHRDFIETIERVAERHFDRERPLAQQLRLFCEEYITALGRGDATHASVMIAHIHRPDFQAIFPISYYEELIDLPYEFLTVPVPLHYDEMLKKVFGNYMMPYRAGGTHEYPYYCGFEAEMMEQAGHTFFPEYLFKK